MLHESCKSTELKRWIVTEMRWSKNWTSLSSQSQLRKTVTWLGKIYMINCVFRIFFWKLDKNAVFKSSINSSGNEFQTVGAAWQKARLQWTRSWLRRRGVNGVCWSAGVVEWSGTGANREDTWVGAWLMFWMSEVRRCIWHNVSMLYVCGLCVRCCTGLRDRWRHGRMKSLTAFCVVCAVCILCVCGLCVWSLCMMLYRAERQLAALTDEEFDSILQRNKSVSSGAILRAVQDASEGLPDFSLYSDIILGISHV